MRGRLWLAGLAAAAALWGCDARDPLAQARAACGRAQAQSDARIEACTALIDSGSLAEGERSHVLASRGTAFAESGDVTAALRDFNAALAIDESLMLAVRGRAAVLIESGQLDAAEAMTRKLLESGEHPADAHYFAGRIALSRGDIEGARQALDRAIAADARFFNAYLARGDLRQSQRDYEGALQDYDRALQFNSRLPGALAGRCWTRVLMEEGDLARARADAEAAVAADARNVQGQLCRGLLQLRAREWDGARASYEGALAVEPGNPNALFGRGVARRRGGDREGREDMNQARDFDRHVSRRFEDLGVDTF